MHINTQTGLLTEARQQPSPNVDDRPTDATIDLLVIHAISLPEGEFGGPWIDQLFCNELEATGHNEFEKICDLKVSTHIFIRRDGEVVQYVPLHLRAWHAGESSFEGCEKCNDFSIGIELEGCDDQTFEEIQYQQLATLTRELIKQYPGITRGRITGHSDISPGRKTDPGPFFDWKEFNRLLG
jgi:AmpD protein